MGESRRWVSLTTRQMMASETGIGRPASSTRMIRQRASSRCFCSRSRLSIKPFPYRLHRAVHRVELGVDHGAEPDPILAAHVIARQLDLQTREFVLDRV